MRVLGVLALVLGILAAFFTVALLLGNDDLRAPGSALLPSSIQDGWRALLGPSTWTAGVWLSVAWLGFARVPGVAWLFLLIHLPLLLLDLAVPTFAPTLVVAVAAVVILGLGGAALVGGIGAGVGGGIRRRRAVALGAPATY